MPSWLSFSFLVIVAARSQLPYLCISTVVTRFSHGLCLLLKEKHFCLSSVFWPSRQECCFYPSVPLQLSHVCVVTRHLSCCRVCWDGSELQAASMAPISVLLPSLIPCLSDMFQCKDLWDMFVCWAGNFLLNYSYPTCNFKRRVLEVLWHHHAFSVYFFWSLLLSMKVYVIILHF